MVKIRDRADLLTLSTKRVPADERLVAERIRELGEQSARASME